jgi:geranylgeranyl transferase type-1 subunit beta
MTLSYFCLGALDLLTMTETKLTDEERSEYIDWIYDQQLDQEHGGGFCSSPYLPKSMAKANLAMTYTALLNLAILRDDFTRLDRGAILHHIRSLQQADGRCVLREGCPVHSD